MNLCPLLILANKSFNPTAKVKQENIHCKGKDCSWYDKAQQQCKLIDAIYKKEYIMKSFNFT